MTTLQITDLAENKKLAGELILDKQFVILPPDIPFSKALQNALMEWNFKTVYEEEVISENSFAEIIDSTTPEKKTHKETIDPGTFEQVDFDLETGSIITKKESGINSEFLEALQEANKSLSGANEKESMEVIEKVYQSALDFTTKIFTRFVTHKELSLNQLTEAMKVFCEFVDKNKKFILRIQPKPEMKSDKNYLVNHCVRSTIIAIVIANQIKMAPPKITELAVTSIIHEIGQIRLPSQLYLTNKRLSEQARSVLSTHTILGFNITKEANFPATIQLGVLEHHERENGKGYPRKIDGSKISTYGKILAVACTYEAISSPRQYKEAKTTYEAIVEMLRNVEKAYDDNIIKALVQAVSLFPIGQYVYLANGKIAQVCDSNPNDPRMPLVQVVGEKNELGNPKVIMTDNDKMRIVRVVNQEELKDILAYIK